MNHPTVDRQAPAVPGERRSAGVVERLAGLSPRARARLAGFFEAMEGFTASSGQVFLLGKLVIPGDAAATAHNILANEFLYRLGFLASVASVVFHLAWSLLMYQLLKPVHRTVASLAAFVIITCCAMQALTALLYLAPLLVLQGGPSVSGLGTAQAQALASVLLKLNGAAFDLDLVFFGFWCILTGYLVWRSTFLPRLLGALLALDGLGWTLFMWPPLATFVFPAIAVAAGAAEIPMQAWLLLMGVDNERWRKRALAAGMLDREGA